MDDKSDAQQIQWVTNITENPGEFLDKVESLNTHPNEVSQDEILLKDGRILDRYSSPVIGTDQTYYVRIWTFRDITARKQAELALRESNQISPIGGQYHRCLLDPFARHERGPLHQPGL